VGCWFLYIFNSVSKFPALADEKQITRIKIVKDIRTEIKKVGDIEYLDFIFEKDSTSLKRAKVA